MLVADVLVGVGRCWYREVLKRLQFFLEGVACGEGHAIYGRRHFTCSVLSI